MLDQGKNFDTLTGVPQGGLASPILFNIYMHEFDIYIKNELEKEVEIYNKDHDRLQKKARNLEYDRIERRLQLLRNRYHKFKNGR